MYSELNQSLKNVRLSPIVSISEQVRRLAPQFQQKTGKQFLLFQRGELDFTTPQYIREAAKKALDAGVTKYPKSGGEDVFKDAILAKLRDFNKADGLTRENIVCTYGGQEALQLSFKLFAGKRGAGFAPCWSCVLENFVPYCDTDFVEVPLNNDFSVDFDRLDAVLSNVAFFYLNTPQNPTGKVFSEEEVRAIAERCRKHSVYLVSDEAYERITYDGKRHFSPCSLPDDTIISTFTLSKTYAMTGWRLGYLVTRNRHIARLMTLADYTQTAGVVTFLQHAGREALDNRKEEEKSLALMLAEFHRRRGLLFEGLKSIEGIEVTKPEGAFYFFPNFTRLIPSHVSDADRPTYVYQLLMDKGVATVYGSCFGKHFVDNVRFSFSTTPVDVIQEGIARMREVFSSI